MRRIMMVCAVLVMVTSVTRAQDIAVVNTNQSGGSTHSMDNAGIGVVAILAPVANEPYQAEKTARSVQTLSDGTVITLETHGLLARNSTGQVREDVHSNISGMVNGREMDRDTTFATVADPVDSTIILWQAGPGKSKIAITQQMPNLAGLKKNSNLPASGANLGLLATPPPPPVGAIPGAPLRVTAAKLPNNPADTNPNKVTHEDLGQQSLQGLLVTGKRTTTVIPVGKIGNDRPITLVEEIWTAPELGIVVKQIDTDPRTGNRTMELTGLTKAEPDAALFHAPPDYKVQDMAQMMKTLGNLGKTPAAGAVPDAK